MIVSEMLKALLLVKC